MTPQRAAIPVATCWGMSLARKVKTFRIGTENDDDPKEGVSGLLYQVQQEARHGIGGHLQL